MADDSAKQRESRLLPGFWRLAEMQVAFFMRRAELGLCDLSAALGFRTQAKLNFDVRSKRGLRQE